VTVIDGVDLVIGRGEAVGLVGASGSGKSTIALALLRLLPGGARVVAGRISLEGVDLLGISERQLRRVRGGKIGLVPQQAQNALSPFLTVEGQLQDAIAAHGSPGTAGELLELVKLPRALLRRYPHELSAGMRQRVVMAIALAARPTLLVLDEPTSALDAVAQQEILGLITELRRTLGLSLLFIGHDLTVVRALCSRLLALREGRLGEEIPAALTTPAPVAPEASGESAPVLEVRGLCKTYRVRAGLRDRAVPAVAGVSFALRRGEVLALVGESGCGKSTTARMIARLVAPSGGEIRLDGRDVLAAEPRVSRAYRGRVQMVFQDPFASLNPLHTVGYHLARPLLLHRRCAPGRPLEAAIAALLEAVGLAPEHARRLPHQLSGGQRQRVAIARALAPEPAVLIADEPTSMLDQSVRGEVLQLLQALGRERGLATLHITHDLAVARAVADRVAVMNAGAIVETAPTRTLFATPAHPYTRLLLSHLTGESS
jgi:peptide/nickel transport system ATP-binding protein